MVAVPASLREILFTEESWRTLEATCRTRVVEPPADPGDWRAALGAAEVLVTSWGFPRLAGPLLAAAPRLGLVAHTGGTVKPIVSDELFARGVRVTQAGAAMAHAVAESCLALTLALLHQVPRFDHALHAGRSWDAAKAAPPRRELRGARIGIVGGSRTGRAYLGLVRALGAEVVVYDPWWRPDDAALAGVELLDLHDLLRTSDVVALHAPTLPETHRMIGARELSLLRDGAGLVNTARAWLVDEAALVREVSSGRVDAALDVFDAEPLPPDHPLRALPNVVLTPHEAAGTLQARRRQGDLVVREVARWATGRPLEHEVTLDQLPRLA